MVCVCVCVSVCVCVCVCERERERERNIDIVLIRSGIWLCEESECNVPSASQMDDTASLKYRIFSISAWAG